MLFLVRVENMLGTLFGKIWDLILPCFFHPYVDIELKSDGYGKRINGLVPSKEPVHVSEAVYNYDFHWDYVMIIKNNSSKSAYNLKIEKQNDFFRITTPLDKTASLQPHDVLELKCVVSHSETMKESASVQVLKQFPYFTNKIQIVLSYQNERHKQFYTVFVYDKNGQNNRYKKK